MEINLSDRILHRSADILAIDKPEGIPTIPERNPANPSLVKILEEQLGTRLFVVHRIDKEASGVVVFAFNSESHRILSLLFEHRKVQKTYTLLVHGRFMDESGIIERRIRQFGSGRMGIDERNGKPSRTGYRIVELFPRATLLEAQPLTGRRHQLRVHFYSLGHPIIGDPRYGDATLQQGFPRLMLHASSLCIPFPEGERAEINAPLPLSFSTLIDAARNSSPPFH